MMHYIMGSDSAPDRIDAIRDLLVDDLDTTKVTGCRETRRNAIWLTGTPSPSSPAHAPTVSLLTCAIPTRLEGMAREVRTNP